MNFTGKSKIVVVGAGNVGEAIAYTIMMNKQSADIVLVDVNRGRAKGSALDINHGLAFSKQIRVREGGYEECADAQIIIITAGIARKPGQTRLDLTKTNIGIARDITRNIMKYATEPLILVVSNPVDVLTYVIQKESGLSPERVIGSGTALDTARFRYLISQKCNVDIRDVSAYILGEHGDSQVPVWSKVSIAGQELQEFCNEAPEKVNLDFDVISKNTREAGSEVIALKGATFYGIAMITSRIVDSLIDDENAVLPVSHVLHGEYDGIKDVAISLPCVINKNGIQRIMNIGASFEEEKAIFESAKKLKSILHDVLPLPEIV